MTELIQKLLLLAMLLAALWAYDADADDTYVPGTPFFLGWLSGYAMTKGCMAALDDKTFCTGFPIITGLITTSLIKSMQHPQRNVERDIGWSAAGNVTANIMVIHIGF